MARAPSSPRLLLLRGLAVLSLLLPVACANSTRSCAVTQWHQGCTTLPLGLDIDHKCSQFTPDAAINVRRKTCQGWLLFSTSLHTA